MLSCLNLSVYNPLAAGKHADKQMLHFPSQEFHLIIHTTVLINSEEKSIFLTTSHNPPNPTTTTKKVLQVMSPAVLVNITLVTLYDTCSVKHTRVPLYEVFQRDRHLLLYSAGVVNMPRDVEELCARVSLSAKA